jgi:hypothetical protein
MSKIEELIRIKKRDPTYTVNRLKPGPDGWERCECPWCGKMRAQIHDERGLFWCPHAKCNMRFAVVRSIIIDTKTSSMGTCIRRSGVICSTMLGTRPGGPRKGEHPDRAEKLVADPGDYRGDPDAPVSSTPRAAWLRAPKVEYDQDGEQYTVTGEVDYYAGQLPGRPSATIKDADSPDAKLERYPLLSQRYGDRLTVATVAAESGFSESTAKRRIREERERYLDEHPAQVKSRLNEHVGTRLRSGMDGFGGRGALYYGDEPGTLRGVGRKPYRRLRPLTSGLTRFPGFSGGLLRGHLMKTHIKYERDPASLSFNLNARAANKRAAAKG